MMCGTRSKKLPRWIGMCSAWQSVSPAALNSAVEQSRRSLMLVECEARISVSPASSTIEAREAPMTSMVMGSRLRCLPTKWGGGRRPEGSCSFIDASMTPPPAARAPPHAMRGEGALDSYLRLQDQIEPGIDPRGRAGRHQGGRIHLLDDGGAGETVAGAQLLAGVDCGGHEVACFRQPHLATGHDGTR